VKTYEFAIVSQAETGLAGVGTLFPAYRAWIGQLLAYC